MPESDCRLSNLKLMLGIPESDTSKDELLTMLQDVMLDVIEDYIGQKFGSRVLTEYYSGDNTPLLVLRARPATQVLRVWVDPEGYWGQGVDPFGVEDLLEPSEYAIEVDQEDGSSRCALLYRTNGSWPRPFVTAAGNLSASAAYRTGNVKVEYVAGSDVLPGAIVLAINLSVVRVWRSAKYGGLVESETTPKYSFKLFTGQMQADGIASFSPEVLGLLARYREVAIG